MTMRENVGGADRLMRVVAQRGAGGGYGAQDPDPLSEIEENLSSARSGQI
jgi:hypothetical protein